MNSQDTGNAATENRRSGTETETTVSPAASPDENNPIARRVEALKRQASALVAENRPGDAAVIVAELLALDDQFLATADPAIVRDILDMAGALLPTGLFDPLERLFFKGIQVLWNHRQAGVVDWFVPLNNLAALYQAKGDYPARDQVNSQIVALADPLVAPLDGRTAQVFIQLAPLFEQAGHPKAAAILYRHLHRFVMSDPAFQTDTRMTLIGKYGNALAADGQLDAACELGDQSLAALEVCSGYTDNHRLQMLGLTAQWARQKGDLDKAQMLLEHARDVAERSAYRDSPAAGAVYHNLASLYLEQTKREYYDEAERLLELARDILAQTGRRESSEYAGELGQLATVARAKGEFERAEALYREALRIYESASDMNPGDFADFLTDAGFLYLRLHRPVEALGVFQRAKVVRESISELSTLAFANTVSNLATAHFACGNFADAIRLYREAIDLRHRCLQFGVNEHEFTSNRSMDASL